jgi:hypothetical protein
MTSVRRYHLHYTTPILTGKSENRPEAKTADVADLHGETKIGTKIAHGARTQASNGRRSEEMTTTPPAGLETRGYSEATEIIIGHVQDPGVHLREDILPGKMTATETEGETVMRVSRVRVERRRRRRRKRRSRHHQLRLRSL